MKFLMGVLLLTFGAFANAADSGLACRMIRKSLSDSSDQSLYGR